MRIPASRLIVTATLFASLAVGQQAPDWRFADPGAQIIGGMDVHGFLTSPLVTAALQRVGGKMGDAAPMMPLVLATLNGVSQVYFSATTRNTDSEGLLMIKGKLDDATAKMFLQGAAAGAAGAANGNTPAKPSWQMVRIDADTVLLGTPALLAAAQRRMERPPSAQSSTLLARAGAFATGYDFWLAGTLPDIQALTTFGAGIKGFSLGVGLQQDLRLQVAVDMTTAAMAQQTAAQIQKSMDDARKTQPNLNARVETTVEGSTLRLTSVMPGDEILKALDERLKDGLPAPGALFGANTSSNPQPKKEPPAPKTVHIYGLDGGPKEVPLPSGQH